MAHLPQMYSLYELYFAAALGSDRREPSRRRHRASAAVLHRSRVRSLSPAHRPGVADAGRQSSRSRTTGSPGSAKRRSTRVATCWATPARARRTRWTSLGWPTPPDVKAIGEQFAAAETKSGFVAAQRAGHGARDDRRGDVHRGLRAAARARTRAVRQAPAVRLRVAHRRERRDAVHDVGADHARRAFACRRHVHAVDRAAREAGRPHRQRADGPVGHRVRWQARPRHGAHDDGFARDAGREVHDLDHRLGRASRDARDGMGTIPVDGADRGVRVDGLDTAGTARNPKRREIPDSAKSQTARNPRRREIPNGAKSQNSAKSQTARNARQREIPNGDKERNRHRRLAPSGIPRRSASRAFRDFAPFGISRRSAFRAVSGTWRSDAMSVLIEILR